LALFLKGPFKLAEAKKEQETQQISYQTSTPLLELELNALQYKCIICYFSSKSSSIESFLGLVKLLSFPSIANFIKFDAATCSIAPYLLPNA